MEAEQYTLDAGRWMDIENFINAHPNAPGTPANAIVGILYETSDRQTLNSYARLIWVRHLHPIPGNCQSLESARKNATFQSFQNPNPWPTLRQYSTIHQINNEYSVGKDCTDPDIRLRLRQPLQNSQNAWVNTRRETHSFTGLPGQPRPMMMSGFLLPDVQARALSNVSMACRSLTSPFSPQHNAIICRSASTL